MAQESWKRDHDETGCQPPEGPFLCVNNCGFFGSSATMNLCSKCYRDLLLKQVKAKAASSSIDNDKNNNNHNNNIADVVFGPSVELIDHVEIQALVKDSVVGSYSGEIDHGREQAKPKQGPNRCSSCKKRVGLTGFNCRCGNVFCSLHRYSDKHDCPFDYRAAGRDAIAKANPVVKAEKETYWQREEIHACSTHSEMKSIAVFGAEFVMAEAIMGILLPFFLFIIFEGGVCQRFPCICRRHQQHCTAAGRCRFYF